MINEYFVTQSLNVAAYLKFKGFTLQKFIKEDKMASYCFDKSGEVFSAVNEYNQNNDLKRFINSYREIRELIYKK